MNFSPTASQLFRSQGTEANKGHAHDNGAPVRLGGAGGGGGALINRHHLKALSVCSFQGKAESSPHLIPDAVESLSQISYQSFH